MGVRVPLFVLVFVGADGEKGVGEHRQGDVPVPGVVQTDLVVVQTDAAFSGFEAFLDRPAGANDPHEFTETLVAWVVAVIESQLAIVDRTANQVLMLRKVGIEQYPIIDTETLGADPAGTTLPGMRSQTTGPLADARGHTGGVGELGRPRNSHRIRDPSL